MEAILKRDGLSLELLSSLSYKSELGISLKKNLHYFNRDELLDELNRVRKWYTSLGVLADLPVDYRIKSAQSISFKYDRYYPDYQVRKVFNDLLGFRSMVDSYDDILGAEEACLKVVDLSCGKSVDDGYRGVHVYFTRKPGYYPVEIQYNTYYDRQINNWLHKHVYKHFDNPDIGFELRLAYERGYIHSEDDFVRRLDDVLSGC